MLQGGGYLYTYTFEVQVFSLNVKNVVYQSWKDGSAGKNAHYSCRGHEFSFLCPLNTQEKLRINSL